MRRGLLRGLGWVILVALIGYSAILHWVWTVSRQDQRRPADAIVVLGAAQYNGRPSPVLRARLDHAMKLYREGLAPRIVLTGGQSPGDLMSEARAGHQYLVANQVPDSALIDRPEGRTTAASMVAVAEWARANTVGSVILISDGFHLGRLRLEALRMELLAFTSPAPASPIGAGTPREWSYLAREALKVPVTLARLWF